MEWSTAIGAIGISAVTIPVVIGFLTLINRLYNKGEALLDEKVQRQEADRRIRELVLERDVLVTKLEVSSAQLTSAQDQLSIAKAALARIRIDVKVKKLKEIDAAVEEDLIAISRAQFSGVRTVPAKPAVSDADGTGTPASSGGGPEPAPVPVPGPTQAG